MVFDGVVPYCLCNFVILVVHAVVGDFIFFRFIQNNVRTVLGTDSADEKLATPYQEKHEVEADEKLATPCEEKHEDWERINPFTKELCG